MHENPNNQATEITFDDWSEYILQVFTYISDFMRCTSATYSATWLDNCRNE